MMADLLPPDWAIERAHTRIMAYDHDSDRGVCSLSEAKERVRHLPGVRAFAEYIAEHEEAPTDPLLIEAREIVAKGWGEGAGAVLADECRQGHQDNDSEVRMALAGLRRGIEIGKAS